MPRLLTPKQEAFCLAYLETGNASEAYRRAYNASQMAADTIHRKAKEVLDNGKVTARLAALRAPAVARAQLTLAQHLADLRRLRDSAQRAKQYGPAIQAEIARGKAAGLYDAEEAEPEGAKVVVIIGDLARVQSDHREQRNTNAPPIPLAFPIADH